MSEYILIIDTGHTLIKAVIFDLEGKEVGTSQTTLPFTSPSPEQYCRDLNSVWNTIINVINKVLKTSQIPPDDITCVSSVGYGNGLILLDKAGRPTYPAVSSNDKRAKDIVRSMNKDGLGKALRPYTLQSIWPGQTALLTKWLKLHHPEILEKSANILLCKDYTNYRLTGNTCTDKSNISTTNFYNVKEHRYDDVILDILELSEYKYLLPEVKESTDICGYVTEDAAELTGLRAGTPVITGLFDLVSSSISTGLINTENKENLILNVLAGTWTIDQYLTSTPQVNERVFATSVHPNRRHWVVSKCGSSSTSNIDWFINNFLHNERSEAEAWGKTTFKLTDTALSSTSPESSDLIFLPFLYGSNIDSEDKYTKELKATFFNISMNNTQNDIIRAIYEGITFSHLYQIKRLFTSTPQTLLVRLSGGGSVSHEWAHMFSDVLQAPVETTQCQNTNALGAAICATIGIGTYSTFEEAIQRMVYINARITPCPRKKDIYAEKYFRYLSLIAKLTGTNFNYF